MNLETDCEGGPVWKSTVSSNRRLVDTVPFRKAARLSTEFALELVEIYLEHARAVLTDLGPAVHTAAGPAVEILAQRLAGSSEACGIVGLVPPLQQLEQLGRMRQFARSEAAQTLATVRQVFGRVEEQLQAYCDSLPVPQWSPENCTWQEHWVVADPTQ